jgi:photosystem II stability/assembly factor-like uncharacterized protein
MHFKTLQSSKVPFAFITAVASVMLVSASCNIFQTGGANGVIKTVDGGQTWIAANNEKDSSNSISGLDVSNMAFNSTNSQTIYLSATNEGLWESQDAADTWSEILSKITVYDFYVLPSDSQTIYAVGTYDGHGKIVRSTDGGNSWTELYNEASPNNSVNSIAVNPTNPMIVYAGLNDGTLLQSIDGGTNWQVENTFDDQILKLRYDPANNLYIFMASKGLQESTDGGKTWTSIVKPLTTTTVYTNNTPGDYTVSAYVKFAMDPTVPGIFYITTNQGLYKTTDNGQHWSYITLPLENDNQEPRAIAVANKGMLVYTSVGTTIYRSADGGNSWQTEETPAGNVVNKILIDFTNSNLIYAGLTSL